MTTSGIYTITTTGLALVTDALIDLGAIDPSETPDSSEISHGIRKCNYIIQQMQGPPNFLNPGQKAWQRETASLTMSTAKNSYSLKPSGGDLAIQIPVEILDVLLHHTVSATDSPLKPISHEKYRAIGDKTAVITPTRYYYERRLTDGVLYLDGKPSAATVAAYTLSISYRQPLEIIQEAKEYDFQPEYMRALNWLLAQELASSYLGTIPQHVAAMAQQAIAAAASFEPETSDLYFEPGRDD